MSQVTRLVVMLLASLVFMVAARADHMTGQYSGSGAAQGINLSLQQSGRTVTGQLSGQTSGTLNGQSDGGENVTGVLTFSNGQQVQFQALHSPQGITIGIMGDKGMEEYVFMRGGGGGVTPQPEPGPKPGPGPQPDPAGGNDGGYYVGVNGQPIGPVTRQQVLDALVAGQITATSLVWKQGMADWAPLNTLPEFAQTTQGPPELPGGDGPPQLPGGGKTSGPVGETQRKISAMMLGSALGVFAHELGHAMIGELGIPATGSEEDTVDEFSALVLSSMLRDTQGMAPDMVAFLTEMVSYSTLLWYHDASRSKQQGMELPWYDEHSAGEARFRNTLCIIYGSSPTYFKGLADRVQFPDRERSRCEVDFAKRNRAWELIVQPFARNQGGEYPGMQPTNAKGAALKVSYQPSQTSFGRGLQTELQNLRLFEEFAANIETLLVWQRDLDIVFADCGTANAFYDPQNARIVMCWEGIEHFFWTVAEPEGITKASLGLN